MPVFIYVTFASRENAREVARTLVDRRLVACANILPEIESIYRWEGGIQSGRETAAIFKTRGELFGKAEAVIKELHSFDCPCIVALPIEKAHEPFLKWIEEETVF